MRAAFSTKQSRPIIIKQCHPDPDKRLALTFPPSSFSLVQSLCEKNKCIERLKGRVTGYSTEATMSIDRASIRLQFDDEEGLLDGGYLIGMRKLGGKTLPGIAGIPIRSPNPNHNIQPQPQP